MTLGMRLWATTLLLLAAAGCAGPAPAPVADQPQTTSSLTVIVWSDQLQRAVPGRGFIQAVGSERMQPFDIAASPEQGRRFEGLAPGRYEVRVTHRRLDAGSTQRVNGQQVVYLEPGADISATVVAVDKKDDLGLLKPASLVRGRRS